MTENENALLERIHAERIHAELHCSPRLSTTCVNGAPGVFEWTATWERTVRHPGYSRTLKEQAVRAPTLAEALTRLLETEWLYDEHERRRLAANEEAAADA
jgi:hypothetical protein